MNLILGVYDAPDIQQQPLLEIDSLKSNIAVFGGPMSGKTRLIETMLVRMTENIGQSVPEDVYIIDFGGNLGDYAELPIVCGCFDNSNEENVRRVFKIIEERVRENARQLGSRNYYTASANPEKCPRHLTLMIENLNAFLADERYAAYQDQLMKFCRDGLSKGLTVVFTANDTSGISRYLTNFGQKFAFNMPAVSYVDIFGSKTISTMNNPGRGLVTIENSVYEFQAFLPFAPKNEENELHALIKRYSEYTNPHKLMALPETLTTRNLPECCPHEIKIRRDQLVFGLDYYDHQLMSIDAKRVRSIGIYGKKGFGKTNLLQLLVSQIYNNHKDARFLLVDDGREQLKPIRKMLSSSDHQYFDSLSDLRQYLSRNGYGLNEKQGGPAGELKETPYTVFVLQSRNLYHQSTQSDSSYLMTQFMTMILNAEKRNYMFIFPDIKIISDADRRDRFNSNISVAFLLDNIAEFIADKGNKTAFGEFEAKELKAMFARCSVGDGYYYDTDADDLHKVKLIKYDDGGGE